MDPNLLEAYQNTLNDLRQHGETFANMHPAIASQLSLSGHHTQDPFVERLIHSFAYLSADLKQQQKQHEQDLAHHVLEKLYPHFLRAIPACSILSVTPAINQQTLIPRGSILKSKSDNSPPCLFTTVYDMDVLPLYIDDICMHAQPPKHLSTSPTAKSCLSMRLRTHDLIPSFQAIPLSTLRFYINLEQDSAWTLYTHLSQHVERVLIQNDRIKKPLSLAKNAIKTVGFQDNEALLPNTAHQRTGYRLLSEWINFKAKFLFIDVTHLDQHATCLDDTSIQLHIVFNQPLNASLLRITHHSLCLHCTPIINLFKQEDMHINYHQQQDKYLIHPTDLSSQHPLEVYDVLAVHSTLDLNLTPHFHAHHDQDAHNTLYWSMEQHSRNNLNPDIKAGYDTFLIVSQSKQVTLPPLTETPLYLSLLCTNRDLPQCLALGGDDLVFQFNEPHAAIQNMNILCPFTPARYRHIKAHNKTVLLSLITITHMGLAEHTQPIRALKQLLNCYLWPDSSLQHQFDQALTDLTITAAHVRHPHSSRPVFCSGLDYIITMDTPATIKPMIPLFGEVLCHVLQQTASINHFVRMTLRDTHHKPLYQSSTWFAP